MTLALCCICTKKDEALVSQTKLPHTGCRSRCTATIAVAVDFVAMHEHCVFTFVRMLYGIFSASVGKLSPSGIYHTIPPLRDLLYS